MSSGISVIPIVSLILASSLLRRLADPGAVRLRFALSLVALWIVWRTVQDHRAGGRDGSRRGGPEAALHG